MSIFSTGTARDIRPVSYIKAHTAAILRQIDGSRNPVIITQNGEAKAVLLDIESYQTFVDSLNMMKLVSIGEKQILAGQTVSDDAVAARVKSLLG
jgi:prevent-host-death family protein